MSLLRAALATLCLALGAMPPPEPGSPARFQREGSWSQRVAFARRLGNHRMDPGLLASAQARLAAKAAGAVLPTPPSAWRGLPTRGAVKLFVLLIDFNDHPHNEARNAVAQVEARVFGTGDGAAAAPYESLRSYYQRASYGQLDLGGTVLGWYRPALDRAALPTTPSGRESLIKSALAHFQSQGHDFTQYDNQGSGAIDYFAVVWSGPDTGWGSFWWGYDTTFSDHAFTVGGKTLKNYSWMWEANPEGGTFVPRTLIHETGHALGLPDYYDYDTTVGPDGGVGRLDMMDGNWGDHNCFSKYVLDWISPAVVTTAAPALTLRPAETSPGDALILVPPAAATGTPFGEYFILQNRRRLGNDTGYPADGLLVWHVDARLDPSRGLADYLFDNSYTDHKLLKLVQAGGQETIETSGATASAVDFFLPGATFGPAGRPSTLRYDGLLTWLEVRNLTASGSDLVLDVAAIAPDATAPTGAPTQPQGTVAGETWPLSWTLGSAADPDSGITGYGLQVGTTPGGSDVLDRLVGGATSWTLTGLARQDGRPLYARVRAMNGAGLFSAWSPDSAAGLIDLPALGCGTLDACPLVFKTVGPWVSDPGTSVQGGSSARSAPIPDRASTTLQCRVTGPGTFGFSWSVSSEADYDFLHVLVDGAPAAPPISGTVAWTPVSVSIPAGDHLIQWVYRKDEGVAAGQDAAWVDQVTWTGGVPGGPNPDVNGDGAADLRDLLAWAALFGTPSARGDLNRDGAVDDQDLALLLPLL